MKKWQKNQWTVTNCTPSYDVVEFDGYGKMVSL